VLERGALVDSFQTHLVFALDDEEASARLLGKPWALTLAEPGRLLVRLELRKEVEILGLHLTEDGLRDLLASMGVNEATTSTGSLSGEQDSSAGPITVEAAESQGGSAQPAPGNSRPDADRPAQTAVDEGPQAAPEESNVELTERVEQAPTATFAGANGRAVDGPARVSQQQPTAELPRRVATLLERARLVIDSENAAVWSAEGQLRLEQSSPIEVLFRLAAAPLLVQGPLDRWPGVKTEELLEEVWAPRARDPRSRDSAQTWLAKNLARLQEDVSKAAGGLGGELLVRGPGTVRVNQNVAVSDVEAFMAAVERARGARGEELIAAAEEALGLRVPDLLPGAHVERSVVGRKIELYRWLGEPQWERAARRLEALGREVTGLLARAYRDAGRHDEALALYAQLLGEDPLDRRAREGLLIAAAGTGDVAQVHEAWQQICVCLGGEADRDIRALYEGLLKEMQRRSAAGGMNPVAAGSASRSGGFEGDRRGD
jgi:tetratricopeptide (TPR) repeat protein